MLEISQFEQFLGKNGKFCLLDWLLSENFINYSHYEQWRYNQLKTLDTQIQIDKKALANLIETTKKHAKTLKLSAQDQEYFSWQDNNTSSLTISQNNDIHKALTQQWLRAQDEPQLDLFMDNSAAIAENHLLNALSGRQWQAARQYLHSLTEHNPDNNTLGQYLDLINYGDHIQENNVIDAHSISGEFFALQKEVTPLAKEVLGNLARDYLSFAWKRIASNLQDIPFNPETPELHRSFALRQIPDWTTLENELSDHCQLYQYPQLLEHLAASYSMQKKPENSLLLWCHIVEKFPEYAQARIEQKTEPQLYSLLQHYWDTDDDWTIEFLPAFILLTHPGLIHSLTHHKSLSHKATLAVISLLHCRQQSENEIHERQNLQKVCPVLLQYYLKNNS